MLRRSLLFCLAALLCTVSGLPASTPETGTPPAKAPKVAGTPKAKHMGAKPGGATTATGGTGASKPHPKVPVPSAWTRLAEKIGVSQTMFQRKKSSKRALDTELHTTKNATKMLHKMGDKVTGK